MKEKDKRLEQIIAFRIPSKLNSELERKLDERRVVGVHSPHQLARMILIDYLKGKMIYLNEGHVDPIVTAA
jgi:hypothetical protein